MNGHDDLGQLLRRHYIGTADEHPADGQLDAVLDRTRVMRPRPAWIVGLRGPVVRVVGRPGATRRVWVAVAILLAVATFVAALAGGMFRSDPPLGRSGTIAYSVLDDPTAETGHVRLVDADGTHDRDVGPGLCPTLSRDGSAVAYRTGLRDTYEVMVGASDGSSPRVVPEVGGSEYALSPDGNRVAWLRALDLIETPTADGASLGHARIELWVTPVAGGPGRRIVPDPADPTEFFRSIAWSPDGRRIAFRP